MTFTVTNRQKRAFIIPAVFGAENQPVHTAVTLNPGESKPIQDEHWNHVSKGNKVIEALLTGRHLVVNRGNKEVTVDLDDLTNPKSVTAPEELKEKDDRVKIDSKVELKEVNLDEPKSGKNDSKAK